MKSLVLVFILAFSLSACVTLKTRSGKSAGYKKESAEILAFRKQIADLKAESITLIRAEKAVEGTPFETFRFYYIPKSE